MAPSDKMEVGAFSSSSSSKKGGNESKMWIEKYRPKSLDTVISHTDIIGTIKRLVGQRKLPHLLFYGPPGTGKTTTMLAVARELNGERYQSMTLELNASDARGIDVIRNQIKVFASTKQIFRRGYKIIILDEADSMTSTAQFALRRVIEQYTRNTRFCIICNYVNRITPAVQSRCTRFRFAPLERSSIEERMLSIAKAEGVNMTTEGLKSIIKLAEGDMRKCLNVMQACHMAYNKVDKANVYLCTGDPTPEDIRSVFEALLNKPFKEAFDFIEHLAQERGMALIDVLTPLVPMVQGLDLSAGVLSYLYAELSDLEMRLARACNNAMQLGSLVGVFKRAMHMERERGIVAR